MFTQYNRDPTGRVTVAYEVEGMITKVANAPVFGLYDFNLRNGGIGGSVVSVQALGETTGQLAIDILNGTRQLTQPVTSIDNRVVPMFDWRQIKRWGGDARNLPKGSLIFNRPPSLWEQYQAYVLAIVLILLAQSFLIAALLVQRRRREKAEEALRESEERFHSLVEAVPEAIFVQTDGRIAYLNPMALRLFGAESASQLLDTPVLERLHPDSHARVRERIRLLNEEQQSVPNMDQVYLRLDGTPVDVDVSVVPFLFAGKRGALVFARDLTERKCLEAQLRQQQKLEALGTLAGGVAHEINNPIAGIMNYAQLIADKAGPGSQAAEYAGEIIQETTRVATIVKNLLQFARQEKETPSPARLQDILEQTLSLLRAVLRRDQIALTVEVPADLPPLTCRSQQLQQVLMNLITNARDALNAKYPGYHEAKTLRITVREVSDICDLQLPICDLPNQETPESQSQIANRKSQIRQAGRPWLRLTVADQGTGIPPEIQGRIFDPFFTTKPRDRGTGLGLSISHGIVKDHHGVLHFETVPGTGTKFYLDLPVDNEWRLDGKAEGE